MPTRIKNCGLKNPESITQSALTGAGFAGFVHHEASPRHLTLLEMTVLIAYARPLLKTVAVLVNPNDALLDSIAAQAKPDYFQLHSVPNPARVQDVASRYGIPVISAISVRNESDLTLVATLEEISTYLLFDAPVSGSGQPFDWRLLKNLPLKKRWFLAGGLTQDNVAEALRLTHAPMVDASSGLEHPLGSGNKSLEKIAAFNTAVLNAANA